MSDSALGLIYLCALIIAATTVWLRRGQVFLATLLGTLVSLLIWIGMSFAAGASVEDTGFELYLFINGFFCLIAALCGAGLTKAILEIRS